MSPFQIYTILPMGMPTRDIVQMAAARRSMITTDGRRILLAPRRLPGFSRVNLFLLSRA